MSEQAMREAFEKDAKLLPCEKLRIPETGKYEDIVTEGEWRGWQAALKWAAEGQEPVAWADDVAFKSAMVAGKGCDVWPAAGDYEERTGRKLAKLYAAPVPNADLLAEVERLRKVLRAITDDRGTWTCMPMHLRDLASAALAKGGGGSDV